jgi:3'-phosphoadenosine 5'-phosphosulfate (PAPS) 3'-phosphatase
VEFKGDDSPLTRADTESNRIICEGLQRLSPHIPIISEETKAMPWSIRQVRVCAVWVSAGCSKQLCCAVLCCAVWHSSPGVRSRDVLLLLLLDHRHSTTSIAGLLTRSTAPRNSSSAMER